jgi:hypothetical protein
MIVMLDNTRYHPTRLLALASIAGASATKFCIYYAALFKTLYLAQKSRVQPIGPYL